MGNAVKAASLKLFPVAGGGNSSSSASLTLSDGSVIVANGYKPKDSNGTLVKISAAGNVDETFSTNVGTGANYQIYSIAQQSDGKVIAAGAFDSWNGVTVPGIVRINSDGTRDTSFNSTIGATNGSFRTVAVQADGKIVAGYTGSTINGTSARTVVRLSSSGVLETTFSANVGSGGGNNTAAISLHIQPDGKIILTTGSISAWNGVTVPAGGFIRLNSDGTRDTAFTTNLGTGASNGVYTLHPQSDGKIIVGIQGSSVTWNGASTGTLLRLNSDGTRDTSFTTNVGTGANNGSYSGIYQIAQQSDGKIITGGYFTTWNGANQPYIVRLNSDGTRDTTFTTNLGTGPSAYLATYSGSRGNAFSVQPSDKILVHNYATTWNGLSIGSFIRLNSDGTLDTSWPLAFRDISLASLKVGGTWKQATGGWVKVSGAWKKVLPAFSVDYLIIAGGGSGGSGNNPGGFAGGGGAGGYVAASGLSVLPGASYTVTVGAGGAGTPTTGRNGNTGSNSQFSLFSDYAYGGGYGGAVAQGGNGGSSGGGSGGYCGGTPIYGQGGPLSQGSYGSCGSGFWDDYYCDVIYAAGAGGGAEQGSGVTYSYYEGVCGGYYVSYANGGSGLESNITGTSVMRAGGGGGGTYGYYSGQVHYGTVNGGATQSSNTGNTAAATANTGSGTGGSNTSYKSGNGGSGVVIIRYPNTLPDLTSIGAGLTYTRTTPTGYKVYTFTAGTGTITF